MYDCFVLFFFQRFPEQIIHCALEAELLEEPPVLSLPETLLEAAFELLAHDGPLCGILDRVGSHELLELKVETVSMHILKKSKAKRERRDRKDINSMIQEGWGGENLKKK